MRIIGGDNQKSMVGIYKITNLQTGECYIGRSIHVEERWKEHFCKGYGAIHSKRFQDAIDQYGKDGFSFRLIEECDPEVLDERERFWINSLKPAYNTVTEGHPVSENTRAKISESLAGRKQPPELVENADRQFSNGTKLTRRQTKVTKRKWPSKKKRSPFSTA